jgi:hypothetical protein
LEEKDNREYEVLLEVLVRLVPVVMQAHRDSLALRDLPVHRVIPEVRVLQVDLGHRVKQALWVFRERLGRLDLPDLRVYKDLKGVQDRLDHKAQLEPRGRTAFRGRSANRELTDREATTEHLEILGIQVKLDQQDSQDQLVLLVLLEDQGRLVMPARRVHKDLLVPLDQTEPVD